MQKNSSNENFNPDFKRFKDTEESKFTQRKSVRTENDNNLYINKDLTTEELKSAIKESKGRSPGPDEIPYAFFQNLPPAGVEYLLSIFSFIWKNHTFPALWKEAIVVPIPKAGKDPSHPAHYRPIALTGTM